MIAVYAESSYEGQLLTHSPNLVPECSGLKVL